MMHTHKSFWKCEARFCRDGKQALIILAAAPPFALFMYIIGRLIA